MSYGPITRSQLHETHSKSPESAHHFLTTVLWALAAVQLFVYGNQFLRFITADVPASVAPDPWIASAVFGLPLLLFFWSLRTYRKAGTAGWLVGASLLLSAVGGNVSAAFGEVTTTSDTTRGLLLACTLLMLVTAAVRHFRNDKNPTTAVGESTRVNARRNR